MDYEFYSDSFTDVYLRNNFFPDYSYKGLMIEVGGGSPNKISSSKHWRNNGWRSIVFEPNPMYFDEFEKLNLECYNFACSNKNQKNIDFIIADCNDSLSYSSLGIRYDCFDAENISTKIIKVDTIRLDSFLIENNINKIDILSIDVEGWELEVMQGFDPSNVDCKIIVLENFKDDPEYTLYMESIGYKLTQKQHWDYIYEKNY